MRRFSNAKQHTFRWEMILSSRLSALFPTSRHLPPAGAYPPPLLASIEAQGCFTQKSIAKYTRKMAEKNYKHIIDLMPHKLCEEILVVIFVCTGWETKDDGPPESQKEPWKEKENKKLYSKNWFQCDAVVVVAHTCSLFITILIEIDWRKKKRV